ncbi:MAG TPA: glycosyltransferase family 2 protein [Methylomirabilota bacterium]|nr:glycosyltransferase family 2 protein [Methylomirabilota bacterium]
MARPGEPPLVSVVTPFYNTARYLRECIESVLAQTWPRFEYILVDNCSTDGSRAIAEEYAGRDPRIRLFVNATHLGQLANFNHALRQISSGSKYMKFVAADDWLYPEGVERLVGVAECRESIGLVSSYRLTSDGVEGTGLPYDTAVFPGHDVCRRQLLNGRFFFGSESTVLYRADLVRTQHEFLDTGARHADTERAYQTLKDHDFGFVHQVLSYTRRDGESISGRVADLRPSLLDRMVILMKYGRDFLDPDEFRRCVRRHELRYCEEYIRQALGPNRARFLAYHRSGLAGIGYQFPRGVVLRSFLIVAADLAFNFKKTIGDLTVKLGLWHRSP